MLSKFERYETMTQELASRLFKIFSIYFVNTVKNLYF